MAAIFVFVVAVVLLNKKAVTKLVTTVARGLPTSDTAATKRPWSHIAFVGTR